MIEYLIVSYLNAHVSAPVKAEIPAKRPKRFVVVEKMGGERENRLDSSTISFKSFAPSLYEATELNRMVKEAVENMTDLDEICSCEYGGDYNDTDTDTKTYCYRAVYHITHY